MSFRDFFALIVAFFRELFENVFQTSFLHIIYLSNP